MGPVPILCFNLNQLFEMIQAGYVDTSSLPNDVGREDKFRGDPRQRIIGYIIHHRTTQMLCATFCGARFKSLESRPISLMLAGGRCIQSERPAEPSALTAMSPAENAGWFARSPISTLSGACHGDRALVFCLTPDPEGIELLGNIVWYRSKAKIKTVFEHGHPKTSTPSRPYARELPQELLEMILAHVILNMSTLKACSATCRSWYIATLPHLHHTLTLHGRASGPARRGLIPLQKLGRMQLLPFVKRLQILQYYDYPGTWFRPSLFNAQSLAYFSALTNVQELGIRGLDFRVFTPRAQRYFGHFTPTLRTLALRNPKGTNSQLLYFLGLFPNLDDLKFDHGHLQPTSTLAPVPQSAPSLRGRLTLTCAGRVGLLRDLSKLSGGLRFHYMHLFDWGGARFLLDTCADTLETLRVYPVYLTGKGHSQVFQPSPV